MPVGRSFQKADILYCGFDDSLLSAVSEELDGPLPLPVSARSGLRDHAISEILNLLLAEVESGGASGTLYAESLAHALAVRFLFLVRPAEQPAAAAAQPAAAAPGRAGPDRSRCDGADLLRRAVRLRLPGPLG